MKSLRDPTFLILLVLADGERHGFGIIGEVETASDGAVRLGPGTLYGALDRLGDEGRVIATRSEVVDGRNRRYYELTEAGRRVLNEELQRRSKLVALAKTRLGSLGGWAQA